MSESAHSAGTVATPNGVRIRFILEQHLGHQTYAENLLDVARGRDDVITEHVPVIYNSGIGGWAPQFVDRALGPLAGRREVRRGLRRSTSDVDVYNTQVPAALAGRRIAKPYVVVTDVTPIQYDEIADGYGHHADRHGPLKRWKHRVNQRVFGEAAHCVAWSNWVAASLRDHYDVEAERIAVIPPGVDIARWRAPANREERDVVRVLFVGGDLHRKGGDLLLEVLPNLPRHVHLTLVTRSQVDPWERVTVVNGLEPNDPRLIGLFHEADVFALPTRAETFGIAAIEASAAGLPVVATAVGGLTDIVDDGTTGILVGADDRRTLGEALTTLATDTSLRQRMGRDAQQRAALRFDAQVNAKRLIDLALSAIR